MLNAGQRFELEQTFRFEEHGFVPQRKGDPGGHPYLQKNAIRRRLDRVAPDWSMSEPHLMTIQDDVVVMTATLTIGGQSHGGEGTGVIQRFKENGEQKAPFELSREVVKAVKGAASDCLTRCAYYYGIGWYLRGIPASWKDRIKTPEGLRDYLKMVQDVLDKSQGDAEKAKAALGNGSSEERRMR